MTQMMNYYEEYKLALKANHQLKEENDRLKETIEKMKRLLEVPPDRVYTGYQYQGKR